MGEIVGAFGVSHTATMVRARERAEAGERDRIDAGFSHVAERIRALAPDAIVLFSSEHLHAFFLDALPAIAIGTADRYPTLGDGGIPKLDLPGAPHVSRALHRQLVAQGFDLTSSQSLMLDHGFATPLHLLGLTDIPVVPFLINCTTSPLPTSNRCHALGEAVARAVAASAVGRVVVLAAGGLSHWVGIAGMGRTAPDFDSWFLDRLAAGELDALTSLTEEDILARAGNGGQEIRSWLAMMGAAGGGGADVLAYEPVRAWVTGIAVVEAHVAPLRETDHPAAQPDAASPSYAFSAFVHRLGTDGGLRAAFRDPASRDALVSDAALPAAEAQVLRDGDVVGAARLGAHPMLVLEMAFALEMPVPDVVAALNAGVPA